MTDIHGISHEQALAIGVPEEKALGLLLELWGGYPRVSHNRTFDQRIIRIACKRYCGEIVIDLWADKESHECTMLMAKPITQLLPKNRYGFKNPKLSEAFKFFTGEDMAGAHNAMADTKACMEIYWAMSELKEEAA